MTLSRVETGVVALHFHGGGSAPPVLTTAALQRLDVLLEEVEEGARAGAVRAVLLRGGRPGAFLAGADLREVRRVRRPVEGAALALRGQRALRRLETLPVPTFAVLDGPCLGAGLELALACAHRLASDAPHTRLGLPEVRFGLLPALGGTVRLPRLVGMGAALELVVGGRSVGPEEARALGLVDGVLPASRLEDAVMAWVEDRLRRGRPRRRPGRGVRQRLLEDTAPGRRMLLRRLRAEVERRSRGNPAPLRALELLAQAPSLPLEDAFAREAAAFGELAAGPESRALLHAATLRRAGSPPPAGPLPPVDEAAVLGGGPAGGALAYVLASAGVRVRIRDAERPLVAEALRRVRDWMRGDVRRGTRDERDAAERMDLATGATGFGGFGTVDLLLEAGSGTPEARAAALREAEEHVADACVLAATSIAVPVARLAEGLERPSRLAGLHLFPSPAGPRLAEVVRGPGTDPAAVAALRALARRLGLPDVVCADVPGFLVYRLAVAYVDEGVRLVEEGAGTEEVDGALVAWGMGAGPLALADEVGMPALARVAAVLADAFPGRVRPPEALERMVRRGYLGVDGGRGFYRYSPGRAPRPDPEVEALVREGAPAPAGAAPAGPEEARLRVTMALLNEVAHLVHERVVDRPAAADLAVQLGLGFPVWRGSLLHHAGRRGADEVEAALRTLAELHGPRFAPAPGLRRVLGAGPSAAAP